MPFSFSGRGLISVVLTIVALGMSIIASMCLGTVDVPIKDVATIVRAHISGTGLNPSELADTQLLLHDQILWQLRVPRLVAALVVGAALATAGAVLQAIVRNPLAEPSVVGASAGASFVSVAAKFLAATFGFGSTLLDTLIPACIGALGTLAIVLILSSNPAGITGPRVILTGVAVSQIALAATSYLQLQLAPTQASAILFWLLGTVAGVDDLHQLCVPAVVVATVLVITVLCSRDLDVISVGDDDATALGIAPARVRVLFTVAVALLTGVAVSLAGTVSFLGLFVPHAVRSVMGPSHRWLIPLSAAWGAVVLVFIDLASRTLAGGQELPLTVFTALIGGPVFLWLLRRSRQEGATS